MNENYSSGAHFSPKRTRNPVRMMTAEEILSTETPTFMDNLGVPLRTLVVDGLLSFGERMSFDFGRLNILIGPNGSGKSNLINCIRILRNAPLNIQGSFTDAGFEDWIYRGKDARSGTAFLETVVDVPEIPVTVKHQIRMGPPQNSRAPLEEVVSKISKTGSAEQIFSGSSRAGAILHPTTSRGRTPRRLKTDNYDAFQSILSQIRDSERYPEITGLANLYTNFQIYSEWIFGRNSNLREATPTGRSSTVLSDSMDNLALVLNGLEQTSAHEKIRVLLADLKETYSDYVTRILFGRVGLELIESQFNLPLPAVRLSDGTLRFLALAAILLHQEPAPLICLEEPELGMHPDMIRMVAGMIIEASRKTQLIITTHSEYLLSALQDDFDVLFAFDTGRDGSIVRRLTQNEYALWREEHTLGELWTSGELGGNRW